MTVLRGSGAQLKAFAGPRYQSGVCRSRRVRSSAARRRVEVGGVVAWAKGGGQPCLKPLGQAAAQNPGPAPLPAQSQNIHLPFQPTSVRIKAPGRRQPLLSSQLVCSLSLLLRLGIGAARGSEEEVRADSAVGLSPPSHHAQPMLCDRLLLSEEGARTRLLQPSSLGGGPPAREAGSPCQVGFLRGEPAGSYYCRGSLPAP